MLEELRRDLPGDVGEILLTEAQKEIGIGQGGLAANANEREKGERRSTNTYFSLVNSSSSGTTTYVPRIWDSVKVVAGVRTPIYFKIISYSDFIRKGFSFETARLLGEGLGFICFPSWSNANLLPPGDRSFISPRLPHSLAQKYNPSLLPVIHEIRSTLNALKPASQPSAPSSPSFQTLPSGRSNEPFHPHPSASSNPPSQLSSHPATQASELPASPLLILTISATTTGFSDEDLRGGSFHSQERDRRRDSTACS